MRKESKLGRHWREKRKCWNIAKRYSCKQIGAYLQHQCSWVEKRTKNESSSHASLKLFSWKPSICDVWSNSWSSSKRLSLWRFNRAFRLWSKRKSLAHRMQIDLSVENKKCSICPKQHRVSHYLWHSCQCGQPNSGTIIVSSVLPRSNYRCFVIWFLPKLFESDRKSLLAL